jgi:hypothetical protein
MQISEIYQFHALLRGISPLIWRRLLVRSDQRVADLHYALQLAFGWSDFHLHRFRIHGKDFGVYRDGGPLFAEDATKVRLTDLHFRVGERFCTNTTLGTAGSTSCGWNKYGRLNWGKPTLSVLAGNDPPLQKTAAGLGRFSSGEKKHLGEGKSYSIKWPNVSRSGISPHYETWPKKFPPSKHD